ncbi:hypothetical protein V6N13_001445 [Hibiscus sabdariffa]|uniref:Uncharacterized protein n=1 Tax=Hibiscus sabdariffa TaxID=183260 RepID=A0ABR2G8C3_9ROSI
MEMTDGLNVEQGVEKQSAGTEDFGDTAKRGILYTAVVTGANEKAKGGHENSCDEIHPLRPFLPKAHTINPESPYDPWMLAASKQGQPRRKVISDFDGSRTKHVNLGSRFQVLQNEDDDTNETNNVSVVAPSMGASVSAQTHDRALKEAGQVQSAGVQALANGSQMKDLGKRPIETTQSKIVPLKEGSNPTAIPHVPKVGSGNHTVVMVIEEGDVGNVGRILSTQGSLSSFRNFGGEKAKIGLKVRKQSAYRAPPRPVLTEWMQSLHNIVLTNHGLSKEEAGSKDPGGSGVAPEGMLSGKGCNVIQNGEVPLSSSTPSTDKENRVPVVTGEVPATF